MRSFNIYIFFTTFLIYFLTGYTSFCQPDEHLVFRKIDEQNELSDNNVQCIYEKLHVNSKAQAVAKNFEEVIIFSCITNTHFNLKFNDKTYGRCGNSAII